MDAANWAYRALAMLLAAAMAVAAWYFLRRPHRDRVSLLLFLLAIAPLAYASLVWGAWIDDRWLRFGRQWLVWLPCAGAVWALNQVLSIRRSLDRAVRWQRIATCACLWCLGLAVCGVELGAPRDRMAVIVAIDHSRSTELVPEVEARLERELRAARTSMRSDDRIGTVTFGANARVSSPLLSRDAPIPRQQLSIVRDGTDLEQALRRSLAELPADSAGSIVLMTDGVATRGNVDNGVAAAVAASVPIDVVPLDQVHISNVRVVKLSLPPSVNDGETFDVRVVVESPRDAELTVRQFENGRLLRQGPIHVQEGQSLLNLRQVAENPGLHRIEVSVSAIDPHLDQLPEDNKAGAFLRVRGRTNALVLTRDAAEVPVGSALASAGFDVTFDSGRSAPADTAGFAQYDLVVLDDVPADDFSSDQLAALASYVKNVGGGLLLMGSPNGMGPGGYCRTPVEDVSPVAFDLKQDRRRGQLSEVLIIDDSGSMAVRAGPNTKLDLANEGAVRSMNLLGTADRLGVMHVDTQPTWTLPLGTVTDRRNVAERIRAVSAGGGGILVPPALQAAYAALQDETSALKHVLLFADGGDAEGAPEALHLVARAQRQGITTSVVALGSGDDLPTLEQLSTLGRGRFYTLNDASKIPAVFARETVTAARAAIREESFSVAVHPNSGVLRGLSFDEAPRLAGYVVTLARARTSVLLSGPDSDPLLATWRTGLGRSAVFTSDYGGSWGRDWANWAPAAQMFAQVARSLARSQDDALVRLETSVREGQLQVDVDALDSGADLDNFRNLIATIARPDGAVDQISLRAAGVGRYSALAPLQRPGAYLVSVQDALTDELLATNGVELSTGDELRPTGTDRATLQAIAQQSGGQLRDTLAGLFNDRLPPRFAYVDVTPWLVLLGAMLLVASVALGRLRASKTRVVLVTAPGEGPLHATLPPSATLRPAFPAKPTASPGAPQTTAEKLLARRRERAVERQKH